MTSEQEAIARLRAKAQSSPDDVAWVAGVPYENYVVSTADLRALLDREARLSKALELAINHTSDIVWISVNDEPAWNLRNRLQVALEGAP